MCGIFGIVYEKENPALGSVLVKAGHRLTYRGYDSVGCGVFHEDGTTELRKDTGKIEDVDRRYNLSALSGSRGVMQLRWATFGLPDQRNAQPHYDCDKNMIGAHNGNIVNTSQLQEKYRAEGHNIRSENDGEMVVHAIEKHYDKGLPFEQAIIEAARELEGDYACVIGDIYTNRLFTVKMGSSLFLGVGEGFICCSSDLPSILDLTSNIVVINDGEFIEFTATSYIIRDIRDGHVIERAPEKSPLSPEHAEKGEFPHYMIKEIHEQPKKAADLLDFLEASREVDEFANVLHNARRVFLVGSGTSYHACLQGAYYFGKLAQLPVYVAIAGQFIDLYGDTIGADDVLVCVSQSGETKDLINVVNYCQRKHVGRILGIVNVMGSSLMIRSEVHLPLVSDLEMSVPATKTFMNQIVMFLYLAAKLAQKKGLPGLNTASLAADLPRYIQETLTKTEAACRELAEQLHIVEDLYCLGYGICHPIAVEAALKIKEVVYSHCEGMYSSEFKHGPLSIVADSYPIIFIGTREDSGMLISHINEVTCRNGKAIAISPASPDIRKNASQVLELPEVPYYMVPLAATVVIQMLAYFMSVRRGIDPDFPRNISKTLTVD